MIKLFKRNDKSTAGASAMASGAGSLRKDGLTDARAKLVCSFQASVESAGACDYGALAIALKAGRMMDKPCNMYTLRTAYNDALSAGVGLARNSRASG